MIPSHRNAALENIQTSFPPYFTCMNISTTSIAFTAAMSSATTMFAAPRSSRAATIVSTISSISHTYTMKYVRTDDSCCSPVSCMR